MSEGIGGWYAIFGPYQDESDPVLFLGEVGYGAKVVASKDLPDELVRWLEQQEPHGDA